MKRLIIYCLASIIIGCYAFSQDIQDGYNRIYYPDGTLSSEGIIRNGKPDGYWKTYYPNAVIKSEGNRKNYILDSLWIFYNEAGDTIQKVNYVMGAKNGYTVVYNTMPEKDPLNRGKVISRELYVNDKREGWSYYYYNTGLLKEEVFYENNRRSGISKEYDMDGTIITIRTYNNGVLVDRETINRSDESGLKQGIWREYYADGKIRSESYYKDGVLNGQYKEYDREGGINVLLQYNKGLIVEDTDTVGMDIEVVNKYDDNGRLIFSGTYKDSIPVGIHRNYDAGGNVISSLLYDEKGNRVGEGIINPDGSKESKWVYYYSDGSIKSAGNFVKNLEEGKWTFYSNGGIVEQEGIFRNGKYDDLWTWYHSDGSVKREEEYYNGVEEGSYTEYDTTGNIISQGAYFDGLREGEWSYNVGDYGEKGNYKAGEKDGRWEAFYPDGTIRYEGSFILGNPDGIHRFYYPDGVLKEENYYNMGISEKNWKKYDEEGNLIITITYRNNTEYRINGEKIDFPETA